MRMKIPLLAELTQSNPSLNKSCCESYLFDGRKTMRIQYLASQRNRWRLLLSGRITGFLACSPHFTKC